MKNLKVLVIVAFILMCSFSYSLAVTLEWDKNNDADYYIVYWGNESGNYNLGHSDNILITGYEAPTPPKGEVYYFAVKAFNSCGNSSDFSEEIKTGKLKNIQNFKFVIDINVNINTQ